MTNVILRKLLSSACLAGALLLPVSAQAACDMTGYHAVDGITAGVNGDSTVVTWQGEGGQNLRASFAIRDGQPVVEQLAARKPGGDWTILASNVMPEFQVTTGKRRISTAQMQFLKQVHLDTPAEIERRKWLTFWDAPLAVPGNAKWNDFLPRNAGEIARGTSSYKTSTCKITSDGSRVMVTFNGLSLGVFSGDLAFTAYRGANLLRQEAIAQTSQDSIAYIYKAGLKGFAIGNNRLVWMDTAQHWQHELFGGAPNQEPVGLRARNRLEILDTGMGSLGIFPTPHQFFFARENEVNLGYVYYRKDGGQTFSLGVMQPEHGEGYKPWGFSEAVWKHRTEVSREQADNFALYNAPAGTRQHMSVYYYLDAGSPEAARDKILAYTHNDVFKPLPGFKVLSGHYHMDLNEMMTDRGTLDFEPTWVPTLKGLGINLLYLGDFHDDSHQADPGPIRLKEQKVYFDATARLSDEDFLVMPAEEVNSYFGGHWYLLLPKPVYFTHPKAPAPGKAFAENDPAYGEVYNLGSAADMFKFVNQQGGVMWTAHPRTKSSEGYPEAYKDKDFFQSDRFIGGSWEALPTDLSEKELCQVRCFGLEDEWNDWAPKPKFMIAEGDTYMKSPEDETYPQMAVNYLKLDRVPAYNESWSTVTEAMRAGDFFGTTGEILLHNWGIEGTGAKTSFNVDLEYTYPLDFAEIVWSDGKKVDRKTISLTDSQALGSRKISIPFDARGKKWVRFTVWDAADDGAWTQPIVLK